jgi:hypothetical protein
MWWIRHNAAPFRLEFLIAVSASLRAVALSSTLMLGVSIRIILFPALSSAIFTASRSA